MADRGSVSSYSDTCAFDSPWIKKGKSSRSLSFSELGLNGYRLGVRSGHPEAIGEMCLDELACQNITPQFASLKLKPLLFSEVRYEKAIKDVNRKLITRPPAPPMTVKTIFQTSHSVLTSGGV